MKATVREYTVKKKVVVVEIDVEEAEKIVAHESDGGYNLLACGDMLLLAVTDALEADRAEQLRKDTEDVPF